MIPGEKVGLRTRAAALFIDLIVLNIIQVVVVALLEGGREILGTNVLVWVGYSVYFEGRRGATPGKILLGIRILRLDGASADYHQVFIRCLAKLLPLLGLLATSLGTFGVWSVPRWTAGTAGLIPALVWCAALHRHPLHQAPHDRIAGTCVIRIF